MSKTAALASLAILTGSFAAFGQAAGSGTQTFTGTLFDTARSACGGETKGSSPAGTCPVTVCTTSFGIRLPDGKLYKFDEGGNAKASYALQKSKKASKYVFAYWQTGKASHAVTAKVTGSVTSDTLNLETVQVD
jgi:hypothetical protein